jgi:hypothetical protein
MDYHGSALSIVFGQRLIPVDLETVIDQIVYRTESELLCSRAERARSSAPSVFCLAAVEYPSVWGHASLELCSNFCCTIEVRELQPVTIKEDILGSKVSMREIEILEERNSLSKIVHPLLSKGPGF